MDKIREQNLAPRRGAGRPKGSRNKTTATAKAIIEQAADALGGAERMVAWAKEAPENERAFWAQVFPRLLPLQVHGDPDAPIAVQLIRRTIVDPEHTDAEVG